MTFTVTPEQINSITDVELAFGTTKLLPSWGDIPEKFKRGNLYTEVAEAIFFGSEFPDCTIEFDEEFISSDTLNKLIRAHLQSREPKHEHKIAGVGYLMSLLSTVKENSKKHTKHFLL